MSGVHKFLFFIYGLIYLIGFIISEVHHYHIHKKITHISNMIHLFKDTHFNRGYSFSEEYTPYPGG